MVAARQWPDIERQGEKVRLFRKAKRRLNLALQGGGVHGAFTWGVLDKLLDDADLAVGWISAASAGAVNAAAVAHGIAHADMQQARRALAAIWNGVERAGVPDLLRLNPILFGLAKAAPIPNMTAFFSPYEFNPAGFDPLRKIINQHIDFEAIRKTAEIELLIAATDVSTGRARLFRRHELTVDVILASSCLPTLHHAVQIDGRYYWDGGFSANPDLVTLAAQSPHRDTLLVQLNPIHKPGAPRAAKSIEDRVNTITFNQPLVRDLETILLAREADTGWGLPKHGRLARLKAHRFHLIAAGRHTAGLGHDSKVVPDMEMLNYLRSAGEREAAIWLERNKSAVGRRSTIDLRARYFTDEPGPFDPAAADQEGAATAGPPSSLSVEASDGVPDAADDAASPTKAAS